MKNKEKWAYYSRNNSFSRSARAESAEEDERLPRTKAAKHLGISVKAFDNGCDRTGYVSDEWHHVGKYANKVDYYDTRALRDDINFWFGARNKTNHQHCTEQIKRLASAQMWARIGEDIPIKTFSGFKNKLQEIVKGNYQKLKALRNQNNNSEAHTVFVKTGNTIIESDIRIDSWGNQRDYGSYLSEQGTTIDVFTLSKKNINQRISQTSKIKHQDFIRRNNHWNKISYSFNPDNVKSMLDRYVRKIIHGNSLSHLSFNDRYKAALIMEKLYGATIEINNTHVYVKMPDNTPKEPVLNENTTTDINQITGGVFFRENNINSTKKLQTMETPNTTQDKTADKFFQNFRSNPTNGYITHKDIYSLLMSYIAKEDKLKILNEIVKPQVPFDTLKGWTKSKVIDEIVKPIINNSTEGERMQFKADVNALKDAADLNFKNTVQNSKNETRFTQAKVSPEEYVKFISENREVIRNASKNEDKISPSMLLIALNEISEKSKMRSILEKAGVPEQKIEELLKTDIFTHTPENDALKKEIVKLINANKKNVDTFKELTNFTPNSINNDITEGKKNKL